MNPITPTTGPELQTLREASGLSREALAELAHVEPRTVKHWETRAGANVPGDVAHLVASMAQWVAATASAALQLVEGQHPKNSEVALIRYRETGHMHPSDQKRGIRADVHGAMVGRLFLGLIEHQYRPRIMWFDPSGFSAWLHMNGHNLTDDTPATRAAWAAQMIDRPAIPHPADQPPTRHTPGN